MDKQFEEYYKSYEDLAVHKIMLDDKPRTLAYKNAIFAHKKSFSNKVVLDVGAGTGILSIFCAQAGAKKVYAVEASNIAGLIKQVIKENNFSNVIEVINKRIEDVELTQIEQVDIIVSEWMGFYLLHEGMLDSVIYARDKFLKPGGLMFPETAELWAAPCSLASHWDYWENVYGVNMKCAGLAYRNIKSQQPDIAVIKPEDLLSSPQLIKNFDLTQITSQELDSIDSKSIVVAKKNGLYQAICIYFICTFPSIECDRKGSVTVTLSTAPNEPETHWKQTIIALPEQIEIETKEPIGWEMSIVRDMQYRRHYDIRITLLDASNENHPVPCNCHLTKCIVIKTYLEQTPDEDSESDDNPIIEDD